MIWNEKHAPKRLDEIAGNTAAVEELGRWVIDWERGRHGKPILLYGPPGTGKSATSTALAAQMGWELIEMNASSLRNKDAVERVLGAASGTISLFGKRKLLLIDEVDALYGVKDRGGTSAITKILKESVQPVILTAADYWDPKLLYLRSHVFPLEFKRVNAKSLSIALARIGEAEGVVANKQVLEKLAEINNGDIRSAINDFQALAQGKKEVVANDLHFLSMRDRERGTWESIRLLFKSNSYDEAIKLAWDSDVDPEMFIKWVEENIPLEYTEAHDLDAAFNSLSRADIFEGRIYSRQHWAFLRYVNVLMTAGVALAKKKAYSRFVKYSFPSILKKLSASRIKRARLKGVGTRIGAKCHCSVKRATSLFVPLIQLLLKDKDFRQPTIHYFEFGLEDVAFLMDKSPKQAEKYFSE